LVRTWTVECRPIIISSNKKYLCYNQADYEAIPSFVRAKLGDIDFALMSACEIWEQINSIMQEAITVYVPQRVVS